MTAVVAVTCAVVGIGTLAYATTDDGGGPRAPAAAGARDLRTPVHPRRPGSTSVHGPLLTRSVPVHVAVPSVGIDSDLLRLGLNADGTLQVPWKPLLAGWYDGSPTPGELGPSIIAGHVDSWATGPAVFYHLSGTRVGARVLVTRADGSVARFVVTAVRSYPKVRFPTDLVYGDVDRAELRLITCGTWNAATQEYDDNVVVYARLTATPSSGLG